MADNVTSQLANNVTVQLIAFFVATTVSIVGSHIGLIRLIGNAAQDHIAAIGREKAGVLVVVEFSLIILIGAPLPIATHFLAPSSSDHFYYAARIVPLSALILVILDWCIARRGKKGYYYAVSISVTLASAGLLGTALWGVLQNNVVFFFSLAVVLAVIAAQFFLSALRLADLAT